MEIIERECALGRWGLVSSPSPSGAGWRDVRCRSLLRGVRVSYVGLPKPLRRMPVAPALPGFVGRASPLQGHRPRRCSARGGARFLLAGASCFAPPSGALGVDNGLFIIALAIITIIDCPLVRR